MDYRKLVGLSINDLDNLNIEDDDSAYGGMEKNKDKRLTNDINRKKSFKQENKEGN